MRSTPHFGKSGVGSRRADMTTAKQRQRRRAWSQAQASPGARRAGLTAAAATAASQGAPPCPPRARGFSLRCPDARGPAGPRGRGGGRARRPLGLPVNPASPGGRLHLRAALRALPAAALRLRSPGAASVSDSGTGSARRECRPGASVRSAGRRPRPPGRRETGNALGPGRGEHGRGGGAGPALPSKLSAPRAGKATHSPSDWLIPQSVPAGRPPWSAGDVPVGALPPSVIRPSVRQARAADTGRRRPASPPPPRAQARPCCGCRPRPTCRVQTQTAVRGRGGGGVGLEGSARLGGRRGSNQQGERRLAVAA